VCDGRPVARDVAERQAADLDPAVVCALRGHAGSVSRGPASARRHGEQLRRLAAGPGPTAHRIRADHDVTHLDRDLDARDNRHNWGSDHLDRPRHHHHTNASTNVDHSGDPRELGDPRRPDDLAVTTRRRTVSRFER
jgi:hypothetical protein